MPYMFEMPVKESAAYLVMVDAQDPLIVGDLPRGCEVEGYSGSWAASVEYAPDAETRRSEPAE
jgi:hypothetical protein